MLAALVDSLETVLDAWVIQPGSLVLQLANVEGVMQLRWSCPVASPQPVEERPAVRGVLLALEQEVLGVLGGSAWMEGEGPSCLRALSLPTPI